MAAKRFREEPDSDPNQPNEKRPRTIPSFSSVIGETVMVNSFCMALEPLLRRVVNEEVENILKRCASRAFTRSPSLRIQAPEPSTLSNLQLCFRQKPSLPIFTGSKVVDKDGTSLQIYLVEKIGDHQMFPTSLPHPIKVEIVVLDGDFPSDDDRSTWTSQEFDSKILKERVGKRPLLAGDCLAVTLRDGIAPIGEIEFTDNSSWIRSRKFRLGARVVQGSSHGVRIREAMTEAFVVKDHRGELYKKHHPPMLEDEVWRLEKIGKDGAFHKKLGAHGIHTVQDFLKLSTVDSQKLRRILGQGMSDKVWEVTMKHARTCEMGNKLYIFQGQNCTVTLNPIGQVVSAIINGQNYSTRDLPSINRSYIANLVTQAYAHWDSLQEIIGVSNDIPLLTQGEQVDQYPNNHHQYHQGMVKPIQQIGYSADKYIIEMDQSQPNTNANLLCYNNWHHGAPAGSGVHYSVSESSSDGELTPKSYPYMNGN